MPPSSTHFNMVQTRSAALPNDCFLPPRKRQRRDYEESSEKRTRKKRKPLCQLNLDVLFLIAEHLHPKDLLGLVRSCKSLRALLMSKSSDFVWKKARINVGLPDCPTDLSEPQLADLAFCARCHGCGRVARAVLWKIRRRYCHGCRRERLCPLSSCPPIVRLNSVLAKENLTVGAEACGWVDKDQMQSFLDGYHRTTDMKRFLEENRNLHDMIIKHANICSAWEDAMIVKRRAELMMCREKREESIFQKLEQHGYEREIAYFGNSQVRGSHKVAFKPPKLLTDQEWSKMWPKWRRIMDKLRVQRLDEHVYPSRRNMLVDEYKTYVMDPTPDGPTFDLLPSAMELIGFGPFRDIIEAPEEIQDDTSFAPVLAKLPMLLAGWREGLDADLAELVRIPAPDDHLDAKGKGKAPSSAPGSNVNKLQLACALFSVRGDGPFAHPTVFYVSNVRSRKDSGSIQDRYGIEFLEEAPYIVRACGLDPNVATFDDMDRRKARLKCLACDKRPMIMNWRVAMWHAIYTHQKAALAPLSERARWQLVDNEPLDTAQVILRSLIHSTDPIRCLLCRPRMGDTFSYVCMICHLYDYHAFHGKLDKIEEGKHYMRVATL